LHRILLVEDERDVRLILEHVLRERTMAGLSAARARGRKGGRRPKLSPKQVAHARKLLEDRDTSIKEVAASLGVNRATIYRALGLGAAGEKRREGEAGRTKQH
jgi:DNA invertase Pin-like site-specific DNA recombinase